MTIKIKKTNKKRSNDAADSKRFHSLQVLQGAMQKVSTCSGEFMTISYILMTTHPFFADVLEDVGIEGDIEFPPYEQLVITMYITFVLIW